MIRIILIEPVLAHYRKDFYSDLLACNDFNFEIIAGENYQDVKSLKGSEYITFDYVSFRIFKHIFYYLKGSVKYILLKKPDAIICTGVDFHLVHTLIIFFIYRFFLKRKFYWWSHGSLGKQGRLGVFLRKRFYKTSNGIFVYNLNGKKNLKILGIEESKIRVVNNSINKNEYGYLNHDIYRKSADRVFTILFCGRITEQKKIDILIKALDIINNKKIFDYKCYIIGDGHLTSLNKLAEELNITDKICFTGAKYGEEAFTYFLNSDLFVYPGGIGLSLLQALSYGIPVITTDNLTLHGPEIELLQPGLNGDLYYDGSVNDLAEKIITWRKKILESENEIKRKCINRIEELGYLPEKVSGAFIDFLKERHIIS